VQPRVVCPKNPSRKWLTTAGRGQGFVGRSRAALSLAPETIWGMTLLGYTRVSTALQDPALQSRALLEAGVEPGRIFSDVVTGSRDAALRPEWAKLAEYAREGDVVVVWRIDRLGRSLIDVLSTVGELADRGIAVRSISDGIDPSTPTGRLMLGMLATLAEYERELIRERVNAGIAAAKAAGVVFGRPSPDAGAVAAKLAVAREAMRSQGVSAREAAAMVGWSRSTFYRHGGLAD
jgi:DNA invertase Pin-like site-specific DNA recombinase